jgi:predicted enzyme related to lactoylglutathione lyase
VNGEQPIGGVMQLPDEAKKQGAPPNWLAHVSTPDLVATTAKAKKLGASVLMQTAVPTVGEFAIIRDPQGAVFSAYQPAGDAPGHDGAAATGEIAWRELSTEDWKAAWSFYSDLFGWKQMDQMDMGEMGTYHIYGREGQRVGGMFNKPPEMPVSAWLFYIEVANLAEAMTRVGKLGGRVLNGPMEVPGGTIAQCMDPQGAMFAVHESAPQQ